MSGSGGVDEKSGGMVDSSEAGSSRGGTWHKHRRGNCRRTATLAPFRRTVGRHMVAVISAPLVGGLSG